MTRRSAKQTQAFAPPPPTPKKAVRGTKRKIEDDVGDKDDEPPAKRTRSANGIARPSLKAVAAKKSVPEKKVVLKVEKESKEVGRATSSKVTFSSQPRYWSVTNLCCLVNSWC